MVQGILLLGQAKVAVAAIAIQVIPGKAVAPVIPVAVIPVAVTLAAAIVVLVETVVLETLVKAAIQEKVPPTRGNPQVAEIPANKAKIAVVVAKARMERTGVGKVEMHPFPVGLAVS